MSLRTYRQIPALSRGARAPRQRGAALLEAVVLLPIFILAFAGIYFAWQLYATKLATLRTARARSWEYASNGCQKSFDAAPAERIEGESTVSQIAELDSSGSIRVDTLSELGQFRQSVLAKSSNTSVDVEDRRLVVSPAFGAYGFDVRSSITTECNETPQDGGVVGLMKYVFHQFTHW